MEVAVGKCGSAPHYIMNTTEIYLTNQYETAPGECARLDTVPAASAVAEGGVEAGRWAGAAKDSVSPAPAPSAVCWTTRGAAVILVVTVIGALALEIASEARPNEDGNKFQPKRHMSGETAKSPLGLKIEN